jgi:hypothetical protein
MSDLAAFTWRFAENGVLPKSFSPSQQIGAVTIPAFIDDNTRRN